MLQHLSFQMVIKFFEVIFTVILITNQVIAYFVQDQRKFFFNVFNNLFCLSKKNNKYIFNLQAKNTGKAYNEKFNDFLQVKLREIMRNGDKDLEIPVIDPYVGDDEIIKNDDNSEPFV